MESVDQPYEEFSRTSKSRLPGASSFIEVLEDHPKDLRSLVNIFFSQTLRTMQSFLGSLNSYSCFIEDFAIYASVLYELREADFYEIRRLNSLNAPVPKVEEDRGSGIADSSACVGGRVLSTGGEQDSEGRTRWEKAVIAFIMLKAKIANTPASNILIRGDPQ